jgi:tRNA-dihydrouridine synthase
MFTGTGEKKSASTVARESFFLEFAREMRAKLPNVPLMVTGGFRTRAGMEAALSEGACDLIGLGRPAIINPFLPANLILNKEVKDDDAKLFAKRIQTPWILKKFGPKSIGSGAEIVSKTCLIPRGLLLMAFRFGIGSSCSRLEGEH